jgi:thioesterase domain-containing protein
MPEEVRFFAYMEKTISTALEQYMPQPYAGQITLFRSSGTKDSRATQKFEELQATDVTVDMDGWRRLALQGIKLYQVPGGHMTMVEEPYVRELASRLTECLIGHAD